MWIADVLLSLGKCGYFCISDSIFPHPLNNTQRNECYSSSTWQPTAHTGVLYACSGYLQAEPPPEITWLRDDEPLSPWVQVINTDGMSQLVIPSSKRSDSAIYTIKAKNSVGEAFFDVEVRVTGELNRARLFCGSVQRQRLCSVVKILVDDWITALKRDRRGIYQSVWRGDPAKSTYTPARPRSVESATKQVLLSCVEILLLFLIHRSVWRYFSQALQLPLKRTAHSVT